MCGETENLRYHYRDKPWYEVAKNGKLLEWEGIFLCLKCDGGYRSVSDQEDE